LQDAKKGVVFQSFPPVLHLQLKRYEYDFNRDMMVKINDRYEFPLEIDLSSFLEEGSDMSESWTYALHGVLVHSGDLNVGHYYALLKPNQEDKWYKFDDDRVTRATMKEVLEENFGGETNAVQLGGQRPNRFNYKRHSSAYMLVYIRKSRLDRILPQVDGEIPSHIPRRIEQEELEEQARRKDREEQHFYMIVRTMSNRQFQNFHGFDIGPWDNRGGPDADDDISQADYFRVRKTTTVEEFLKLYAEKYKIDDISKLLLYTMVSRQNKTFRLDSPVVDLTQTVEYVREKGISKFADLRFWVEDSTLNLPDSHIGQSAERSLIFLKYFDPVAQQITGAGTAWISSQDKVGELAQVINNRMNWPTETHLRLLEEIKPDMVDELKPKLAFAACEISDGDIICFERILDPQILQSISGYKTASDFYDFLQHRISVTFEPKPSSEERLSPTPEENGKTERFDLWLSRKDTYDEMSEKVGHRLGVDATHLQFFINGVSGAPRPIKRNGSNIQQLLAPPYVNQYSKVVMYEILDMSLAEFENKKNVSVSWLTEGLSQEHKHEILVPKTATMKDVIDVLKVRANVPENEVSRIKMWGASSSRLHKMFTDNYPVISLVDSTQIYAAVSPEEEFEFIKSEVAPTDERLVFALHFQKEPHRPHGIPFTFILRKGEKFSDTKCRLQKVLGFYDKIFEKIKFAIVKTDGYASPVYINDDDELFSLLGADESLGLDHYDKTARRGYGQQAIFIKN
jgi:ubiquitin carboxyl-terminal hydrolase 7